MVAVHPTPLPLNKLYTSATCVYAAHRTWICCLLPDLICPGKRVLMKSTLACAESISASIARLGDRLPDCGRHAIHDLRHVDQLLHQLLQATAVLVRRLRTLSLVEPHEQHIALQDGISGSEDLGHATEKHLGPDPRGRSSEISTLQGRGAAVRRVTV